MTTDQHKSNLECAELMSQFLSRDFGFKVRIAAKPPEGKRELQRYANARAARGLARVDERASQ